MSISRIAQGLVLAGGAAFAVACGNTDFAADERDPSADVRDAGTTPEEHGQLEEDAGTVGEDPIEGPIVDAGTEPDEQDPADAGQLPDVVDAGRRPDAGTTRLDAGTPPPVCPTSVPVPTPFTGVNGDPGFLQVYVNNVENLEVPTDRCPGDWQDLFYYMKKHPSPDVFLVQQVSGKAQLDALAAYMTANLPGSYEGIIAEADPAPMTSPCGKQKGKQTNAIIYRTGRLTPIGSKHVWQSYAKIQNSCRRNFQARTKNVLQKFHDKVANKDVTVASLHWSTFQGTGPDPACAERNADEAAHKVQQPAYRGDLMIFGGDFNEPDRTPSNAYRPWYDALNADLGGQLGFRDPVFSHCKATSPGAVKGCLDDNWSCGGDKRIDFLFARKGNGCLPVSTGVHTITFEEADAAARQVTGSDAAPNYSDHRAIRAAIHY